MVAKCGGTEEKEGPDVSGVTNYLQRNTLLDE